MKKPFLSIVIPLYNEEGRIKNLYKVYNHLKNLGLNYEILLVNDGSTDNTLKKINSLNKKIKFMLVSYNVNKGKGAAIKEGMLLAKGKYLLFTDIDLSTPIEQFNKFIPHLQNNDILIGSRRIRGSNIKKRQSLIRENLGRTFTILSQIFLKLKISDFTCGFKCFSKKAAQEIFSRQKINRWGFDSEILFLAKKLRYKIKEVPVEWSNDPNSKILFPHDIFRSLFDLYKIRLNEFRKIY